MKVVYRRYASLFFLVGIDAEEVSATFAIMYDRKVPLKACRAHHCHSADSKVAIHRTVR